MASWGWSMWPCLIGPIRNIASQKAKGKDLTISIKTLSYAITALSHHKKPKEDLTKGQGQCDMQSLAGWIRGR